jgi:hypothetical protein
MDSKLELPIRSHLQKYLVKKLNMTSDVVDVSLVDPLSFGLFVRSELVHKKIYYTCGHEKEVDDMVSKCTEKVYLNIGSFHKREFGTYFTNEKIFYINKFLHNHFINELFCFIQTQNMFYPRIVVSYAIDDFYSIFGISENELPKDTIIRCFKRKKDQYSYLKRV